MSCEESYDAASLTPQYGPYHQLCCSWSCSCADNELWVQYSDRPGFLHCPLPCGDQLMLWNLIHYLACRGAPLMIHKKTQMQARTGSLILQLKHGMGKRNQLSLERASIKLESKTAFSAGYTLWSQHLHSIGEAAWKGCQWEQWVSMWCGFCETISSCIEHLYRLCK